VSTSSWRKTYPAATLLLVVLEAIRLKTTLVTGVDMDGLVASSVQGPTKEQVLAHGEFWKPLDSFPCLTSEDESATDAPCSIVVVSCYLITLVLEYQVLMKRVVDRDVIVILREG
jgi:hypothetical protein